MDQRAKLIAVGADQVTATDETGASLYGDQPRTAGAVYLYTQATEFREATGHQVRKAVFVFKSEESCFESIRCL